MKINNVLVVLVLVMFSVNCFARYGFDRIRCKGDLVEEGYSLEKVLALCGEPIEEKNWGNQYQTKKWYVFKNDTGFATYYLYFENDRLVESRMQP